MSIIPNFKNRAEKVTKYIEPNMLFIGLVGALGFPAYYIIWYYLFPQAYENLFLRIIGAIIFIPILIFKYIPKNFKKYFHWYFLISATYSMPFFFIFMLLKNEFSLVWHMSTIASLFLLITITYDWLLIVLMICCGFCLACLSVFFIDGNIVFNNFQPEFIPIYFFGLVGGMLFSYRTEITNSGRLAVMRSLSGSISHELRNPLGTITLAQNQIKELLLDETKNNKTELLELNSKISDSVSSANQIINVILADLSERPITSDDFSYLEADKTLAEIIRKFGYSSEDQKQKVKLDIATQNNFIFKAITDRFTFIVYNLLNNALYYLKDYPDSIVTIGAESRTINGKEWNSIYVHDTGPGIPSPVTLKLFDDFFTSGKKNGTGLGLAFCRRNMKIFDGDIICESEFGDGKSGWTKFSLLLPKIYDAEINKLFIEDKRKKILIVDDEESNLIIIKSKIEKFLPDIACDIITSGAKAIMMIKNNSYKLVLMDIQMPGISGIETAKEIRKFDQNIPIIAFTSLDKDLFLKEIGKNLISESDFHYYLSKPSIDNILYRTITKWVTDINDGFYYLGEKNQYIKFIKGKKIILADDQLMVRTMIKRILYAGGAIVTEVNDGKELLEIYKNSLDKNNKSDFDIIITDMSMPPYDGDEAVKEIRKIESLNNIKHFDEIPIIALSGNGQKEDIHHFFKCQMTDYFTKGNNPELLLQIVSHYLGRKKHISKEKQEEINLHHQLLNNSSNTKFKTINYININHFNKKNRVEILNLFLKNSKKIMSSIKKNVQENNIKELLLNTHAIKGSSGTIGAERLFNYINVTEPMLKKDILLDGWLRELIVIYDELVGELENALT